MSYEDLITATLKQAMKLPKTKRVAKTRKLVLESPEFKEFIKTTYPTLYEEAFGN